MDDGGRFDACGYVVRLVFGHKPWVYKIPGVVEAKVWRFPTGISVRAQSLSEALDRANELANLKKTIGDADDGIDEER